MKTKLFSRSIAAVCALVVALSFFSTPSHASYSGSEGWHHHHHHHFKKAGPTVGNGNSSAVAAYVGISIACATVSVMTTAAMNGNKPLTYGQAHGAAIGCFLPLIGPLLLTSYYERMCALSRTNPALRAYRIYCSA